MAMREKALSSKTLVSFLQGLEGTIVKVEFRDESSVTGRIDSVDGYMNIEMSDVKFSAASGVTKDFSKYCCQGKFLRYVHVPEEVDAIKTIEDRLDVLSRMKVGRGRGRGGGRGRSRGGRGGGGRGRSGYSSRPSYSSRGGGGGGYGSGGSYGSYRRY